MNLPSKESLHFTADIYKKLHMSAMFNKAVYTLMRELNAKYPELELSEEEAFQLLMANIESVEEE